MNSLQNKATSSRIEWIDYARAIAIFLVIVGHIDVSKGLNNLIYSFHMPLFFIISGLTFNKDKVSAVPIKEYTLKNFKRLVIPYFWIEFLSLPLWFLVYRVLKFNASQSFFENLKGIYIANGKIFAFPSRPAWFLLTLFVVLVGYRIILKIADGDEVKEMCLVLVCALLSVVEEGVQLPWRINVAGTGITFVYIGTKIMSFINSQQHLSFKKDTSKMLQRFILWCVVLCFGLYSHNLNGRISMATNKFGKSSILFYITAVLLSLVFVKVVKLIPKSKLLSYIGRNTLIIVGFHKPIIMIVGCFVDLSEKNDIFKILISIIILVVLAPVCALFNKIAPYVAGTAYKSNKLTETSKYIIAALASAVPAYYALKIVFSYIGMQYQTVILGISLAIVIAVFSICFVRIANKYFPIVFASDKN